MGIVSDHLVGLIAKQVEDSGLVVWYDPQAEYGAVVERLELPVAGRTQEAAKTEIEGKKLTMHRCHKRAGETVALTWSRVAQPGG